MPKILLVEDDSSIVSGLSSFLHDEGFECDHADGQSAALAKLEMDHFDLILLDVSLREGNGFALCSAVKNSYDIPIIFLTASGDEGSVVAGLDIGAEDYIAKPFRPRELISRIKSCLRRSQRAGIVRLDNVVVDTDKGTVTKNGAEITLSALEYRILLVFIGNRGKLLSRTRLLDEIWDVAGDYVNDNTLTVYIKRIREKLEDDPSDPKIIKTVRGLGYRVD